MPVYTPHRTYNDAAAKWKRCRDAAGGTDAVKAAGVAYLPLLESANKNTINNPAYQSYKARALFYPATGRTVTSLVGLIFGKPPTVTGVPKLNQPEFDDVTLTGVNLASYGLQLCQEVLTVGRAGILVDMPPAPSDGSAPPADVRPYWVTYCAEAIVNWTESRINGRMTLIRIVLRELVETANPDDEFNPAYKTQYRVLTLENKVYTSAVWIEDSSRQGEWVRTDVTTPKRRGKTLDYIPFVFVGPTGTGSAIDMPPLVDLVDVNLSHYRTSADQEHGAHYTALPTPFITGHTVPDGSQMEIGSGVAWILPETQASCGMLEFSGAGLAALAALKEEKRLLMATLGARMLETQKTVAEAAVTVAMRHAGERSALVILADAVSQAMTQAMKWHLTWVGVSESIVDKIVCTLNPDIMDTLSADDLTKLVAAWQAGAISHKTVYYNMQWGEWTRPGVEFEEEVTDIEDEGSSDEPPTLDLVPPQKG